MEAQVQGEWSLADGPEGQLRGAHEGVFLYHLTSRTEWSSAIFARPQLCSYPRLRDNSCSPNSGFAVGLGTSEGTPNREVPPQEMRPRNALPLFPSQSPQPPGLLNLAGAQRTCCAESGIRVDSISLGAVGRKLYSSSPERRARVLQLPSSGLRAARAEVVAPRRPGSPGYARGSQRADRPSPTRRALPAR